MTPDEMDDLIDRWHDSDGAPDGERVPLHEYLGMTNDQYGRWLTDPSAVDLEH